MKIQDFQCQENTKTHIAFLDGMEIWINETDLNEAAVARAEQIVNSYPGKKMPLAVFCMLSDAFKTCYPDFSAEEIAAKLHMPVLKIDNFGGTFTYCNHELDYDHLIDIEFTGIIDKLLSVEIDG